MKRGLDWYKRDPQAMRMAIKAGSGKVNDRGERVPMTTAQACVYSLVIDLIYENGGEFPNNAGDIASHLSDMGQAKARTTINELIDMGKLFIVDGMLHEKRAEIQAETKRNLSVTRAELGRKGGISSGISRRGANENKDIGEANASSKTEADVEREEEKKVVVVVDARASDTLFRRVLEALRLNPNDRLPTYWMPPMAEIHVGRWSALGLTDDEIVSVAAANLKQHGTPPEGPRALDRAMQRLAGEKRVEALQPAAAPVHRLPAGGDRPRIITSEERRAAMARGREEAS